MIKIATASLAYLLAVTAAHASDVSCAAFVSEYKAKKGKPFTEMSPEVRGATYFLLGAYLAVTKQGRTTFDNDDFNRYLSGVSKRCDASSLEPIVDVALIEVSSWKLSKQSKYVEFALIDLKLDISKLTGKEIETVGNVQIVGDVAMIQDGLMDSNPLFLDFKKVSREQRKQMLEQCSLGCRATIQGKIGNVMFQNGIIADAVVVD